MAKLFTMLFTKPGTNVKLVGCIGGDLTTFIFPLLGFFDHFSRPFSVSFITLSVSFDYPQMPWCGIYKKLCPLLPPAKRNIDRCIMFIFHSGQKFWKAYNIPCMSINHWWVNVVSPQQFFPPDSCSICKKKQNKHFIVPKDDFTLLEVTTRSSLLLMFSFLTLQVDL